MKWVFETRPPGDQPTTSQCVRFSFEATSRRHAVDLAGRLRRVSRSGVWVRAIAGLEEEMRRVAREEPGIAFTGWLLLSGGP